MSKLTKQEKRILAQLKLKGSINPIESWMWCGVYRLGAIIFNLKKKGFKISTERKEVLNKFGEPCSFANYILQDTGTGSAKAWVKSDGTVLQTDMIRDSFNVSSITDHTLKLEGETS